MSKFVRRRFRDGVGNEKSSVRRPLDSSGCEGTYPTHELLLTSTSAATHRRQRLCGFLLHFHNLLCFLFLGGRDSGFCLLV